MSYIYDDYVFHYMVDDGLTYLCLADEQQKRRIPFLFLAGEWPRGRCRGRCRGLFRAMPPAHLARRPSLADVRDKFTAAYGSRAKTAIAYAMPEFARTLADRMTYFNDNPAADSFGKVKDQLAEVKDVMVENIGAWRRRAAAISSAAAARTPHPTPPPPTLLPIQSACSRAARRLSCWWTRATS